MHQAPASRHHFNIQFSRVFIPSDENFPSLFPGEAHEKPSEQKDMKSSVYFVPFPVAF